MERFVDVSNNNGHVDFAAVKKAGAVGVYLKVTEGVSFVDPDYDANYAAAKAAGLLVGGYHFGHPKNDPAAELAFFLSHLKLAHGDLLPVLDLEETDGEGAVKVHTYGAKFLAGLGAHIGEDPVLYSGESFMHANVLDVLHVRKWVADYGARPVKFDAWQFTDGLAKYGPAIDKLDTSYIADIQLFVYKAKKRKRVIAVVKKHAVHLKGRLIDFDGLRIRVGSAVYRWFERNRKKLLGK